MACLLFVADDDPGAVIGAAARGVRLDEDGDSGLIAGIQDALSKTVGEQTLIVIRNDESLLRGQAPYKQTKELFLGFRGERIAALIVNPDNLLMTGDDAGLDGSSTARIGEDARGIDTGTGEATTKVPARFVIDDFVGCNPLASEDTEGLNRGAEGSQIGSDVASTAETTGLVEKVDDWDGGLGGEAGGGAQEITIEHEVAEDGDANLAETREQAL